MKKLYELTLYKTIEVDEPVKSIDAEGKEITIISKVSQKNPHKFFLAKPGRFLREEAELFYNSIYWQCIREYNIMPISQIQKRYLNDGGILSDQQKKDYNGLYEQLFSKQSEQITLKNKTDKTEEDKAAENKILEEIVDIYTQIQDFEGKAGNAIYQNTAENIAQNRTSLWWMLHLAYKEVDGKEIPLFDGETYKQKLKSFDVLEEKEDPFDLQVFNRLNLVASLWYLGKAETQEEFDLGVKVAENKNIISVIDDIK